MLSNKSTLTSIVDFVFRGKELSEATGFDKTYDDVSAVNDVNPLHIIDNAIANLDWRDQITSANLQAFTVRYMAALPILAADQYTVKLMKKVSRANPRGPNFFKTVGSIFSNEALSVTEKDSKSLPQFTKQLLITDTEGVQTFNQLYRDTVKANPSFAVTFKDLTDTEKQQYLDTSTEKAEMTVFITLSNMVVSSAEIVDIVSATPPATFMQRLFGWWDGAETLVEDLILNEKTYQKRKRLIREKNSTAYKEIIARQQDINTHNMVNAVKGSSDLSYGRATNIFTISTNTKKAIETATGMKLKGRSNIKALLKETNMLLLTVVDPDTEIVQIFFSNGSDTTLTKREAFKLAKNDNDISKALSMMVSGSPIRL